MQFFSIIFPVTMNWKPSPRSTGTVFKLIAPWSWHDLVNDTCLDSECGWNTRPCRGEVPQVESDGNIVKKCILARCNHRGLSLKLKRCGHNGNNLGLCVVALRCQDFDCVKPFSFKSHSRKPANPVISLGTTWKPREWHLDHLVCQHNLLRLGTCRI